MKNTHATFVLAAALCLSLVAMASAQRTLERAEILDIFQELTDQPRRTWIPAGPKPPTPP